MLSPLLLDEIYPEFRCHVLEEFIWRVGVKLSTHYHWLSSHYLESKLYQHAIKLFYNPIWVCWIYYTTCTWCKDFDILYAFCQCPIVEKNPGTNWGLKLPKLSIKRSPPRPTLTFSDGRKMSEIRRKLSENVEKCRKMSENVGNFLWISKFLEKFLSLNFFFRFFYLCRLLF